jgi:hypothetical protein
MLAALEKLQSAAVLFPFVLRCTPERGELQKQSA